MHNLLSIKINNTDNLTEYPFKSKLYQKGFQVDFSNITIFVGENGVGKSTLLESLAYCIGFSTYGGNANNGIMFNEINRVIEHNSKYTIKTLAEELNSNPNKVAQIDNNVLSKYISLAWRIKTKKGLFMRAETFATLINLPKYQANDLSHGEGLIEIVSNIRDNGIYILDEPESGLSPSKIIELMIIMLEKQKTFDAQFIISTHSPILMCMPESKLLEITEDDIHEIKPEETMHFQLTRRILNKKDDFIKKIIKI